MADEGRGKRALRRNSREEDGTRARGGVRRRRERGCEVHGQAERGCVVPRGRGEARGEGGEEVETAGLEKARSAEDGHWWTL